MGGVVSQLVVAPFLVAPLERVKVLLQVRLSKHDLRAQFLLTRPTQADSVGRWTAWDTS